MTRTIQSLEHVNLEWLNETLQKVEEFKDNRAIDLNVKRVGEGIGQLGEFALLELKLKNGDDLNLFLKKFRQTPKIWITLPKIINFI